MEDVGANTEWFPVWKRRTPVVLQFAECAHQACRQSLSQAFSNCDVLQVFGPLMPEHAFGVAKGRIEPSR